MIVSAAKVFISYLEAPPYNMVEILRHDSQKKKSWFSQTQQPINQAKLICEYATDYNRQKK